MDYISRGLAIEYITGASFRKGLTLRDRDAKFLELITHSVIDTIEHIPAANVAPDEFIEFVNWVAKEVCCLDYEWDSKSWSFQEIACRKLVKLGIVKEEDGTYLYEEGET